MARDDFAYQSEGIDTEYLRLQTHVRINAVRNHQTFKDDFYNIIIYKGKEGDQNLESFLKLCMVHAQNSGELNFKEFFYSLISLFQLPGSQGFLNAVGLYGELKLIQNIKEKYGKDISESWHKKGSYSQFDFSRGKLNIEVKTTVAEEVDVTIKHHQIFGDHNCILSVVNCEQCEDGETLEELIAALYKDNSSYGSVNFNINLAKEIKRVSPKEYSELRIKMRWLNFFDTALINPFPILPDNVSSLVYKLHVSELVPLSDEICGNIVQKF